MLISQMSASVTARLKQIQRSSRIRREDGTPVKGVFTNRGLRWNFSPSPAAQDHIGDVSMRGAYVCSFYTASETGRLIGSLTDGGFPPAVHEVFSGAGALPGAAGRKIPRR